MMQTKLELRTTNILGRIGIGEKRELGADQKWSRFLREKNKRKGWKCVLAPRRNPKQNHKKQTNQTRRKK